MGCQKLQQWWSRIPKLGRALQITRKVVTIVLFIALTVIGALHLEKCPVQPMIPVFMVVSGAFGLALAFLWDATDQKGGVLSILYQIWSAIVPLFLFCCLIAGSVWIYKIYQPNYDPQIPLYCNKTVYLFAFWVVTLGYIAIGFIFLVCCCAMSCMCTLQGLLIIAGQPTEDDEVV